MLLEFEWDETKNAVNISKHGVSFEEAKTVFFDSARYEDFDHIHSFFEERWIVVGLAVTNVITVIYTERFGRIRIISARKAERHEKEKYFYGHSKM